VWAGHGKTLVPGVASHQISVLQPMHLSSSWTGIFISVFPVYLCVPVYLFDPCQFVFYMDTMNRTPLL
jgi:hypothetical protein